MVAGFEGAIERRSVCSIAGLLERMDLCVRATTRAFVPSLADDLIAPDDDGADHGVGRHQTATSHCKLQRPPHVLLVVFLAVSLHVRPLHRGEVGTRGA